MKLFLLILTCIYCSQAVIPSLDGFISLSAEDVTEDSNYDGVGEYGAREVGRILESNKVIGSSGSFDQYKVTHVSKKHTESYDYYWCKETLYSTHYSRFIDIEFMMRVSNEHEMTVTYYNYSSLYDNIGEGESEDDFNDDLQFYGDGGESDGDGGESNGDGGESNSDLNNCNPYPVEKLRSYGIGIHFYSGDLSYQFAVEHYCNVISLGFSQCILYQKIENESRITGIEYVISKNKFQSLPEEEKELWSASAFTVKNGLVSLPDLSPQDELKSMESLIETYGKIIHVWDPRDNLPLGAPKLGSSLALSTQVDWNVPDEMDKEYDLKTTYQERKEERESLVVPQRDAGADHYLVTGEACQFEVDYVDVRN
jgi:hypothetical protein